MKFVEPIRDLQKISSMKKILLAQRERDYLLFVIGINSPYRISDLIRVQFHHVIDEKEKVRSHLSMIEQKTKKENKVALSKGVQKAILSYVETHYSGDPNEYLFKSRKGVNRAIGRVQAWQILSDAAEELGLENIGTHSLRKTFGYHQIKRGTNITLLMKMFNHSSESVTLRYIGITQDDMDGSVHLNGKKLDEFYVDGKGTLFGQEMVVPKGYTYVMGDNRSNSTDSRVMGAVPESEIIGSLMVRILPILK